MEKNRRKCLKILTLLLVLILSVFSINSVGAEGEQKKVSFFSKPAGKFIFLTDFTPTI